MRIKCIFFTVIFLLNCCSFNVAQNIKLVGELKNADTKMSLANATVIELALQEGTISDEAGYFSLTLPKDSINLEFSYVGYQSLRLSLLLTKDTTIIVYLTPSLKLQTVEVIASESPRPEEVTALSTVQLSAKQINQVPTFFGEQDVLKVLQLLPGVQSGAEGQSGLQVRGGSPDQNLILLDGIPIYNPSHLFGFFSAFNGDVVKDVSLITGGFPAQYAGRLSSIVDISTHKGSLEKWDASASVGLVSGKLMLQGPLIKNKTSIFLAARRSLIDVWQQDLLTQNYQRRSFISNTIADYVFTDYNATIFHQLTAKDELIFRTFQGKDDYGQREESNGENRNSRTEDLGTSWENFTTSFAWNRTWNHQLKSQLLLYFNQYTYGQERLNITESPEEKVSNYFNYEGGIKDLGLKWAMNYQLSEQHQLKYGLQLTQHQFFTGDYQVEFMRSNSPQLDIDSTFLTPPLKTVEGGLFVEDEWTINPRLSMRAGLHLAGYQVEEKRYVSIQPRLSIRAIGQQGIAYKFSFATMQQHLHLLTTDNGGFPADLWLPATEQVRPQKGWVVAAQIARTFKGLEVTIEPYYRIIKNPIAYGEGNSILNPGDWQDKVVSGQGRMYGAEFLLRKKAGKLTGWLGYTLSWSRRQFEALNNGDWYPYTYDRRHNLSVVANYQLGKHWRFSANWVYYTGQAYTVPTHLFVSPPAIYSIGLSSKPDYLFLNGLNNFRYSDYHRLDASLAFLWGKKIAKNNLSVGVYNAYNRRNAAFIDVFSNYYTTAGGEERREVFLEENSLYGLIPFVNLKIIL